LPIARGGDDFVFVAGRHDKLTASSFFARSSRKKPVHATTQSSSSYLLPTHIFCHEHNTVRPNKNETTISRLEKLRLDRAFADRIGKCIQGRHDIHTTRE
jgi:hypothetical protein